MEYGLNIGNVKAKTIRPLSGKFYGKDLVNGKELSFTNYYMQIDGRPFMAVSGECHYARVHESQWEDTILKMKMGGINIIATYVFWIHHEEVEGQFRFDGNRNIRKFLELCARYDMYVIVRIGPFDHGEVRNGGLPDWLYGKPFEVRSANEGFLRYTRRLYRELAGQFEGLYFKDGGPIIGAQIENEYMHSAAPWELTTGITNEWVPGGSEGVEYMKTLKAIAWEEGIRTPFYTCTGWGGAATPVDEMLPVWGGYAFWPWIFYDYRGEHPATPEYIYRDNHNNEVPKTYNFEPSYEPESLPYACCEMGGGMACFLRYRFQLPYESVDAMANIKLAGGCNFLGYYMYRGGSNPKGEKTPYLNECQCPKISYDYQAPIGEYGQVRPSYYRLKAIHQMIENFGDQLCALTTVLPEGSQEIRPEDVETLRYAVRTDGKKGFLFLNNYQDHVVCKRKEQETIRIQFQDGELVIPDLSLAAGESAILPFGMDVGGYRLRYAKAQPLSVVEYKGKKTYFFFIPEGMDPEYVWEEEGMDSIDGKPARGENLSVCPEKGAMSSYQLSGCHGEIEIVTLTRKQSLMFYEIQAEEQKTVILYDGPLTFDGSMVRIERYGDSPAYTEILMYPECRFCGKDGSAAGGGFTAGGGAVAGGTFAAGGSFTAGETFMRGFFTGIRVEWPKEQGKVREPAVKECGFGRYTMEVPEDFEDFAGYKDAVLRIDYRGSVGHLFIDGELMSDHFCNGAAWEIGLKEIWNPSMGRELTILITPEKADATVDVSSTMAGRLEQMKGAVVEIDRVRIVPLMEQTFRVESDG